jgi:hypothetical protein
MAWHGMAYYIFPKSLTSLEEFRKNPHVKIPTKSPSTIFQSLAIINNQILFGKEFFLHIRPNRPSGQLARPGSQPHRPPPLFSRRPRMRARPISVCVALAYLPKAVSSSSLRSPTTTPSPSVTTTRAPLVSFVVSPTPADRGQNFSAPPLPPRCCPAPRMPLSFYSPPSSHSPLNPLQTER